MEVPAKIQALLDALRGDPPTTVVQSGKDAKPVPPPPKAPPPPAEFTIFAKPVADAIAKRKKQIDEVANYD